MALTSALSGGRKITLILWGLLLAALFLPDAAFACPLVNGLVDFNCDGQVKVAAVGDSIVRGIGDLERKNNGGYVARLQIKFRKVIFANLGLAGYGTDRLISEFKTRLSKKTLNRFKKGLTGADIIIIDAGRNDFFSEFEPALTVTNLKRLAAYLRRETGKLNRGPQPYIAVAALLPTTRGFQREFVDNVNLLLFELSNGSFPVVFPFNQLDPMFISVDGIHPDSTGYAELAILAEDVLEDTITPAMQFFRPDGDSDGIYDRFEKKFKTSPSKRDSDSDGLKDGEEVFDYGTDPLISDTDGDGVADGAEVTAGTDPLSALS